MRPPLASSSKQEDSQPNELRQQAKGRGFVPQVRARRTFRGNFRGRGASAFFPPKQQPVSTTTHVSTTSPQTPAVVVAGRSSNLPNKPQPSSSQTTFNLQGTNNAHISTEFRCQRSASRFKQPVYANSPASGPPSLSNEDYPPKRRKLLHERTRFFTLPDDCLKGATKKHRNRQTFFTRCSQVLRGDSDQDVIVLRHHFTESDLVLTYVIHNEDEATRNSLSEREKEQNFPLTINCLGKTKENQANRCAYFLECAKTLGRSVILGHRFTDSELIITYEETKDRHAEELRGHIPIPSGSNIKMEDLGPIIAEHPQLPASSLDDYTRREEVYNDSLVETMGHDSGRGAASLHLTQPTSPAPLSGLQERYTLPTIVRSPMKSIHPYCDVGRAFKTGTITLGGLQERRRVALPMLEATDQTVDSPEHIPDAETPSLPLLIEPMDDNRDDDDSAYQSPSYSPSWSDIYDHGLQDDHNNSTSLPEQDTGSLHETMDVFVDDSQSVILNLPRESGSGDRPRRILVSDSKSDTRDWMHVLTMQFRFERVSLKERRHRRIFSNTVSGRDNVDSVSLFGAAHSDVAVVAQPDEANALSIVCFNQGIRRFPLHRESSDRTRRLRGVSAVATVSSSIEPSKLVFISAGYDHDFHLWSVNSSSLLRAPGQEVDYEKQHLAIQHKSLVQSLLVNGNHLLSAGADCVIQRYDLAGRRSAGDKIRTSNSVYQLHSLGAENEKCVLIEVAHRDSQFELHDFRVSGGSSSNETSKPVARFGFLDKGRTGLQGRFARGAVEPSTSQTFVSGGRDGNVRIWDLRKTDKCRQEVLCSPESRIVHCAFEPDGNSLAVLSDNFQLMFIDCIH